MGVGRGWGVQAPQCSASSTASARDATICPGTWQFVLEPVGEKAARLILRARSGPSPTTWFDIVAEPGYFVLTRGMLLGIKRRAEAAG